MANIHFICLLDDERATTNTTMFQWLENDLAAATQDWAHCFFIIPVHQGQSQFRFRNRTHRNTANILPVSKLTESTVLNGHAIAWNVLSAERPLRFLHRADRFVKIDGATAAKTARARIIRTISGEALSIAFG